MPPPGRRNLTSQQRMDEGRWVGALGTEEEMASSWRGVGEGMVRTGRLEEALVEGKDPGGG